MEFLDYYTKSTDERLDRIESKIDDILKFKWQVLGGSAILGIITSLLVTVSYIYLGVKP